MALAAAAWGTADMAEGKHMTDKMTTRPENSIPGTATAKFDTETVAAENGMTEDDANGTGANESGGKIRPERNLKTYWTLFKTTFIVSLCTFGGGLVIISVLQKKFVEELKWLDKDEVMDLIAIAQSAPGVMACNTSIIIGYSIAGTLGGMLTILGTVTPPMIVLTIVSMFYQQVRSNFIIALLLKGMQAGVAAVVIDTTINMGRNVLSDRRIISFVMLICAIIAIVVLKIDIILVIIACGIIGGFYNIRIAGKKAGKSSEACIKHDDIRIAGKKADNPAGTVEETGKSGNSANEKEARP